jgi:propionate CoA-transferase
MRFDPASSSTEELPMSNPRIVRTSQLGDGSKIVSAREAVRLIRTGDSVAIGGFLGIGFAQEVIHELAALYVAEDDGLANLGRPRDLTLIFSVGPGDGKSRGVNRLARPGLVKRTIGGHWAFVPMLQQFAVGNQMEAYNLPLGVITHLYRDVAGGRPGHLSRVGLGTFVDPRFGGGKLNPSTTEDLVELMTVGGSEYLFYKASPINVGIVRGTTADAEGNITMEREALTLEALAIAMAAHNSGGLVIVQVERIAESRTLNPRQVKIPGVLVDCVVVAQPENHMQTYATAYSPAFSSELRVPLTTIESMQMSERKIIARRAAMELRPNSVVNLGVGMPEGVASVANEEKIADLMTLTAEPGVIGGIPAGGLDFGAATNAQAVIDMPYQFDFYDGGGLDAAFLGLAQVDKEGNINVSKFGSRLPGAGGFINISQNARKCVFVGTFTAGGLEVSIVGGTLRIERDGKSKKFVNEVEHRTFSGPYSAQNDKHVLYITERCVFQLTKDGMELTEVAPGIDIKRDILEQMEFEPIIRQPRLMDARIFAPEPMGLREDLLSLPFDARFRYDEELDILFLNFEGLEVKTINVVDACRHRISRICEPLGHKAYAIVNYDGFVLDRDVEDAYREFVKDMGERYFLGVTRFTTSAFMRAKLGDALVTRGVAPHIFESESEAKASMLETVPHR